MFHLHVNKPESGDLGSLSNKSIDLFWKEEGNWTSIIFRTYKNVEANGNSLEYNSNKSKRE
ncbi:hypothetical protein [Myroides odoratus]|uniref:hypothetical protein n=1 Tax=Myroides odoratus TaxID=256 RepID=UPI000B14D97C|nr:hypothetical protein [Myroides odoratus]